MTYEGEMLKSLILMHHNPLILKVPVINEKLRHSELCNCCCNAEDGQKDKSVVDVIS
jgi:hypothetical protein